MKSGPSLRISAEARADVRSILRDTAREWGSSRRDLYRAQLKRGLDRLLRHPELGQERDDLFGGCRSLRVEQHIVYDRVSEAEIVVGRVLHVRQDAAGKVKP